MKPPDATIRVFIALDIPAEARQVLSATVRQLQAAIPGGVRWVDPASVHLTLKFLGDIDPNLINSVFEAMLQSARGVAPFQLRLLGLGLFPNARQPRVLWAGVDGDLDPLKDLQKRVDESVSALGFSRERQPFHPHLTLGRLRDGVSPLIRRHIGTIISSPPLASHPDKEDNPPVSPLGEKGESSPSPLNKGGPLGDLWPVDAVHLICSTLTSSGAVYTSLGSVPL